MIESTSHSAHVEWKRRRKEYEEEVPVRCGHDPERKTKMATSVANSSSGSLLEVLFDLEQLLLEKITTIISAAKNDTVPDVAAAFKVAVRMNLQESNVRERVVQLFRSSGRRLKCMALEHEREFQRRKRHRPGNRGGRQRDKGVEVDRPVKNARQVLVDSTPTAPLPGFQQRGAPIPMKLPQHGNSSRPTHTLEGEYLKCNGDHWLIGRPEATQEDKVTLLRHQHERHNQVKANRKRAGQQ
ncbi:hypothetical protein PHMEG_00026655 [Phytophthora megakarya]|uniref:Uncharacterized protein n=1 Tax=Phytophthora megakarya TaxID=4795 RepID=A0A225VAS6_9STRA|nr:hypothetical protein PHMEG_00026655 [Phytophthora megakarya]